MQELKYILFYLLLVMVIDLSLGKKVAYGFVVLVLLGVMVANAKKISDFKI